MSDCEMCKQRSVILEVLKMIEALPELGVPLFDDVVTDVLNAADDAQGVLRHDCDESENERQ